MEQGLLNIYLKLLAHGSWGPTVPIVMLWFLPLSPTLPPEGCLMNDVLNKQTRGMPGVKTHVLGGRLLEGSCFS